MSRGFPVIILLVTVGFFAALFGLYRFTFSSAETEEASFPDASEVTPEEAKQAEQANIPFYEMTIPGLRGRGYESELTRMDQRSTNSNYTTYFATYNSDGFGVNGMLARPVGEMPSGGWPAIVFIHGYIPPTQYQTMVNYNSYVDYLAKNGFVVFKIDLRGHADSEGDAHGAYYSGDYVVDTLNAKAALESTDFVRDGAVGLWGHSMAGNVVFRSMIASGEISAVAVWAGAVYTYEDWEYGIDDNSYRPPDDDSERARRRKELFDTHGEFDPNSEFWKLVPATNFLNDAKGSIQVHHAVNDNVVTVEYSRNLMRVIGNSQINHQLFEYADGGHNMTGSAFKLAMQRTVDFFKEKLI